ncbi:helix-turn-helix domain-containing protein [Yinghuangia soli]|uniref:Helix-turn-helix domain-containing protein n=1 Tax=Yinghuangia soli TaxID=2908204 RepID=A0AA41PWJ3_9ACTN|nr:helix-turn-helix transcriptional regulator [Yinghuangia soli]MCF2525867.1 helix-turn-helix domain-containing protein [Yinghuangia soli]
MRTSARAGQAANGRGERAARPAAEPLWREVLGDQLRALRRERGETLIETSGRAGISPQYLSEVERGIKEPSSEMIAAMAGALDVSLVELTLGVAETLRAVRPAAGTARASVSASASAAGRYGAFALAA